MMEPWQARRVRELENWRLVRADEDGTLVFDCYRYGRRYVLTVKIEKLEALTV